MIMIIILYDIYLHDYTYNYKCIYMIIPRIKAKQFSYFKQSSSFSMLETSSFFAQFNFVPFHAGGKSLHQFINFL